MFSLGTPTYSILSKANPNRTMFATSKKNIFAKKNHFGCLENKPYKSLQIYIIICHQICMEKKQQNKSLSSNLPTHQHNNPTHPVFVGEEISNISAFQAEAPSLNPFQYSITHHCLAFENPWVQTNDPWKSNLHFL